MNMHHGPLVQRVNQHVEQTKKRLDTKLIEGSTEYKNRYRELNMVATMLICSMEEYTEQDSWEEADLGLFIDKQFEEIKLQIEKDQERQLDSHRLATKLQMACIGFGLS